MNIYKITLLIVAFVAQTSFFALAQEDVNIKKRDFRIEHKEVGFKDAWKNIKKGDKYFTGGFGTYHKALDFYLKAHKYNRDCAKLNYKIGVCCLATDQFYKATDFLEKAYLKDNNVAEDISFMLGRAYHLNLAFDKAIEYYKAYYNEYSSTKQKKFEVGMDNYIKQCKNGKKLVEEPVRVIIENLGGRVNSEYDDYNPVLHPNKDLLYFTSRREIEGKNKIYDEDNKYFENIFVSEQAGELWKKANYVENKLESNNNASVLSITDDGEQMYIYNGKKNGGDIIVSELKKGTWRSPQKISRKLRSNDKETTITFSPDGKELFLVSDREGSLGGTDIFYSRFNEKENWTEPTNMGPVINTVFNEEGVFWHPTEDKIYFSSQGHNSIGGYDIFVSERDVDGIWSEPVNLGYPLNTPGNELFFKMEENNKQAYYSSIRESGEGGLDLYKIIFLGEEKELEITTENVNLVWEHKPVNDLFYVTPKELKVDTALFMTGIITDSKLGTPLQAKIQVIDTDLSKIIATGLSDTSGTYKVRIPQKKDYGVEVTAKDYLFYVSIVNLSNKQVVDSKIQANFQLDRIDVGAKMILNNIFFETNKSTLKPESTTELERVATLLKENPGIRLEISGHTDNVGSYRANQKLSEARAKSVVDYLIDQGVDKSRLEYKGYSFTEPVADNNTAEGRAQNRRVEFEVLSK